MAWYNDDERRVMYEDDLVVVYGPDGDVWYKGIQDYNPYKNDDWKFDTESGVYSLATVDGTITMKKVIV